MTSIDVSSTTSTEMPEVGTVDMKLEVVTLPVSDVDRAKRFYQSLGWRLDADIAAGDAFRVVQLTPPHSPCSVAFGKGVTTDEPGSVQRLLLAVYDIDAARADLVRRGAEVSEVFHLAGGRVAGPDPEGRSYQTYASFSDPDGNGWLLQEIKTRLPGREWEDPAAKVASLASLLHETAEHHDHYEKTHAPHNWWDWYAAYFDAREHGETPDEAVKSANRYMDEVLHVAALLVHSSEGIGRAAMAKGYSELANESVSAANGIDYAYRDTGGDGGVPLVLLQHFRGNLDNWDPALIDALASDRRVVTFDNTGVGGSTGTTPDTIEQMARDAIAFLAAMEFGQVDLLGFSIGSFVAQQIALTRPAIVRRLVLASAAPQGAAGMHGWAPEVIGAIGTPETSPEAYLDVFFTSSDASRQAGQEALHRMYSRTEGRDQATTWATREAQYDAVCTWGIPDHALLQRLGALDVPVFVANGDSDPMILPHYSYLLAGLIPQARLKIYPDSAHGFLFQHHAEFAADVGAFLADAN
jgi:pimeloyl-ACP methyl ester carboxylesterase/predicted enzyme related to lactoylglutathione lyase